jgi:hypothetical protein
MTGKEVRTEFFPGFAIDLSSIDSKLFRYIDQRRRYNKSSDIVVDRSIFS